MNKKHLFTLFLFTLTTVISLFLAESLARFFIPKPIDIESLTARRETHLHYINQGFSPSITPSHIKQNFNLLPLTGISNTKTFYCSEGDNIAIYLSDKFGFRNKSFIKNPEIALLGDSFAKGACVKNEETICGTINKENKDCLNLGVSATGPLSQFAIYKEYVENIKVKRVYWLIYPRNDFFDLRIESKKPSLINYLNGKTQRLISRQSKIDLYLNKIKESYISNLKSRLLKKNEFSLMSFLQLKKLRELIFYALPFKVPEIYIQILNKLQNKSITFVFLPSLDYVLGNYPFEEKVKNEVIKHIEGKFKYIDLYKFNELLKRKNFSQGYPAHYNKKGYSIVAKEIIKHFNANE